MTRCLAATTVIAVFAASILLSAAPALAARAPKSAQEVIQEQQDLMVQDCKLTSDQQKVIQEKFAAKLKALEAWDKANGDKLRTAEEAAKAARQGNDAAKKTAGDNLKALNTERAQSAAEADKAILAVLTDDQKAVWAGSELAQATLPKYRKASLTDDQVAKIEAACVTAARELAAFTGDDRKDKQGRTTVQKCLKWAIDNVILTPDQREIAVPKKPANK